MANTCTIATQGVSGKLSSSYQGEFVSETFYIKLDVATRDIVSVANAARVANSSQFPLKGQSWPANPFYGLFAKEFDFSMRSELGYQWQCVVTYAPLEPNEPNTDGNNDNPLLWPAVYAIDWIEYEEAVKEARNVETIGSSVPGGPRNANTVGLVVNSALKEFEEGLFVNVRDAVLSITKNVANLDQVLQIERDYSRTTNSDTVFGIGARRYKYLGVESGGVMTANGITYFPRTIRVQVMKSTDSVLYNIGWHYYYDDAGTKKLAKFKVKDEDSGEMVDSSEPQFLLLTGNKQGPGDNTPTKVTYRHLAEVPYASLLA